eukprot:6184699-Pleurochrysis_carterae.AAC.2
MPHKQLNGHILLFECGGISVNATAVLLAGKTSRIQRLAQQPACEGQNFLQSYKCRTAKCYVVMIHIICLKESDA